MDLVVLGVLSLIGFLMLMFAGMPIPFAMLFAGILGISAMLTPEAAAQFVVSDILNSFSSYTLTVGPLFGLMGFLANYSGVGAKLFTAVNCLIGHFRGGLAMATQFVCAIFGAICGSVPATIGTMSSIAYPEMRKRGYRPELAGTCIAAGAHLSILIPPSNSFIIYGLATSTSIGALFVAGILPGIILTLLNVGAIAFIGWRHSDTTPKSEKASWKERVNSVIHGSFLEVIFVFVLSMGGMMAGVFTPTEAGAVGAFGLLVSTVITRKLNFRKFLTALTAGVRLMAMIYMILACATVFGRTFTVSKIPLVLGNFINELDAPKWVILLAILGIYFLLGMVADLISMMLITMPVFYPIICDQLGYDPVWFGVVMIMMINIGMLTPPVGGSIFVVNGCIAYDKSVTLTGLFGGILPFVVALIVCTALIIIFPEATMWLPNMIYK
jgi:tripartite ATP-independent transporter DctM subunit